MQTANLFVKFVENAENKWNDIKNEKTECIIYMDFTP